MLRLAFVLLLLLLPTVLPCEHIGRRAGHLNDRLIHTHVVVFGKVNCAPRAIMGVPPTVVTLELGHREVDPSDYKEVKYV